MSERATVLLLGARGFVGSHVRAAAESQGLRVIGAQRTAGGGELECDLTDPDSVAAAVRRAAPDLVVNLAGFASVAQSWDRPAETFEVNTIGVVNLLEAVAAHAPGAHVLCASSAEVYAPASEEELPLREDSSIGPLNPYGASKASMEIACEQYARSRGVEIAVIRAFNQLGPGQSAQFAASDFASQVARAELDGEHEAELKVGNLEVARDFVDVRDCAQAYLAVARRRLTGTFNLCSGQAVELQALIEELERASRLTLSVSPTPVRARPAEARRIFGSAEKLREATGWSPQTPLRKTLSDLLDWWRSRLTVERSGPEPHPTGVSG